MRRPHYRVALALATVAVLALLGEHAVSGAGSAVAVTVAELAVCGLVVLVATVQSFGMQPALTWIPVWAGLVAPGVGVVAGAVGGGVGGLVRRALDRVRCGDRPRPSPDPDYSRLRTIPRKRSASASRSSASRSRYQ